MLKSWSASKAQEFQKCRYRTFLLHVEKVPEPQRPLPPGKTEHANDRGTRIHTECELYVRGELSELGVEAEKHFGPQLDLMRVLYEEGLVSLEGEWGMNEDWEPCEWRTAWLRLKLDALVFTSPTSATAIDYKTGKRFGNEIKHAEQLQLYQLVTFLRYPQLEEVTTELWYLDIGEVHRQTYTRAQGLRFRPRFDRAGRKITTNTDWKPNPNIHSCKWCEYGPWGTGHCQVGVRK